MSSGVFEPGTVCYICWSVIEHHAVDSRGDKWDVCEGICAFEAGIDCEKFPHGRYNWKETHSEWLSARALQRYI